MNNSIAEIREIIETVSAEWRDNDGGSTWAATDVIRIGNRAISDIEAAPTWSEEQRSAAISDWWEGCFSSDTGAESDICSIAQSAIATTGPWH